MLSNSSFPELWSPEMVSALSYSLAREHHMQIINIRPWNLLSVGHWRAIPSFQIHCGFTRFQSRVFTLTLWVFFFLSQSKLDLVQTVDVCHALPHVFNKIHMTKAASFCRWCLCAMFLITLLCMFFFFVIGLLGTDCQFWTSVFSLFSAFLKITADIEQVTEAEVCSRAAHWLHSKGLLMDLVV